MNSNKMKIRLGKDSKHFGDDVFLSDFFIYLSSFLSILNHLALQDATSTIHPAAWHHPSTKNQECLTLTTIKFLHAEKS